MCRKMSFCLLSVLLAVLLQSTAFARTETRLEVHEVPDFVSGLIAVAKGEIGYTEGKNNYSKYGEWAGDPNAQWCAEFVCWVINRCDELYGTELLHNVYPFWTGMNTGRDWFIKRGRFVYRLGNCPEWGYQWEKGADHYLTKNEYIPGPGDLVYFSYNSAGDTSHVALIEYVTRDQNGVVWLHVIEGNNPDRVQQCAYRLDNSNVLGFGLCGDWIDTVMRFGCSGDTVMRLQGMLRDLGYLESEQVNGLYQTATKEAVAAFQRAHMPPRNYYGIADRETQQKLQAQYGQSYVEDWRNWLVEE